MNNMEVNNIEKFSESMIKFTMSVQDLAQSFAEFSSEMNSIESRYHPIVLWVYKIGGLIWK